MQDVQKLSRYLPHWEHEKCRAAENEMHNKLKNKLNYQKMIGTLKRTRWKPASKKKTDDKRPRNIKAKALMSSSLSTANEHIPVHVFVIR